MNERGFTLLEAVIYTALCALLLGGLLPVAYELVRAAEHDGAVAAAMDEAAVIDRTLYWTMTDAKGATVPSPDVLVVTKNDGKTVRFGTDGNALLVTRGDGQAIPLAVAFPMTQVAFAIAPQDENGARAVTAAFTLGPSPFTFRFPLPRNGLFPSSCMQP